MAEKKFWSWLNLGRDGQPLDGESGTGQRYAAVDTANEKEYRKYLQSEAKTVLVVLFVLGIGIAAWYTYDKRLHATQLRRDIDILVRRIERLEAAN